MKNTCILMISTLLLGSIFNGKAQISDIDGNVYATVEIGNQTWMAENLKTTRLNDGTPIPLVEAPEEFLEQKTPAVCWYRNISSMKDKYGGLYNWYTVNTWRLCPEGWHVPTDEEWLEMEIFIGLSNDDALNGVWDRGKDFGALLKLASAWEQPVNEGGALGFNALPGGLRADDGSFMGAWQEGEMNFNLSAVFWTVTARDESDNPVDAYFRSLNKDNSIERNISANYRGHSVRCIKDY